MGEFCLETKTLLISNPMSSVCDTIAMFYEFNQISTLQLAANPILVLNIYSAYVRMLVLHGML